MTPHQVQLVEDSFRAVVPIRSAAAEIFYRRLFEIDPTLRSLFAATDMAEQGSKLMASLGFVVQNLRRADEIVPAIQDLARRHVGYGVQPDHYETVGAALIETLREGLGESFCDETCDAWAAAYKLLSGVMREAQAQVSTRVA